MRRNNINEPKNLDSTYYFISDQLSSFLGSSSRLGRLFAKLNREFNFTYSPYGPSIGDYHFSNKLVLRSIFFFSSPSDLPVNPRGLMLLTADELRRREYK